MIDWIKNIFKKKDKNIINRSFDDKNIEWSGHDGICLKKKNYPSLEQKNIKEKDKKMKISVKIKKEGLWEVNGVLIYADSAIEAQTKYLGK